MQGSMRLFDLTENGAIIGSFKSFEGAKSHLLNMFSNGTYIGGEITFETDERLYNILLLKANALASGIPCEYEIVEPRWEDYIHWKELKGGKRFYCSKYPFFDLSLEYIGTGWIHPNNPIPMGWEEVKEDCIKSVRTYLLELDGNYTEESLGLEGNNGILTKPFKWRYPKDNDVVKSGIPLSQVNRILSLQAKRFLHLTRYCDAI
jgi:hypothetical protein